MEERESEKGLKYSRRAILQLQLILLLHNLKCAEFIQKISTLTHISCYIFNINLLFLLFLYILVYYTIIFYILYDKSQFFLPIVCKSWLLWYSIYIIITIVSMYL